MPGKLKVKVVAGRDLPVMDRASDLTDAFVEIRFGNNVYKTDVFRKSLNPQWNSEWFKFEVEDEELQDESLELRVLDHDTYTAHDAIGKIYIDLDPLLNKESPSVISGWFPIYDTMHGIRGELSVIVKVALFSDFNKFRQSSCGVQFFFTPSVPCGWVLQALHGFVEELVVNDDPEYQWIDKLRTPRASNEARQRLFSKLSGEVQRKIGLKVLDMGGNAVIGYRQCFDLEGESGIVVRGIGTAVTISHTSGGPSSPQGLSPLKDSRHVRFQFHQRSSVSLSAHVPCSPPSTPGNIPPPSAPPCFTSTVSGGPLAFYFPSSSPLPEDSVAPASPTLLTASKSCSSPSKIPAAGGVWRRSSDSDMSTPPKGSLAGSSGSGSGPAMAGSLSGRPSYITSGLQQQGIELVEYPFFSMLTFPPRFIQHIGGVVSARSVKLLDKIHNPEEPETRDAWWSEIRTEIRSHMRAMGCHAVIGYSEKTSICDDIIVLSAIGTAAKISLNFELNQSMSRTQPLTVSLDKHQFDKEKKLTVDINLANSANSRLSQNLDSSDDGITGAAINHNCRVCHVPYSATSAPFAINLVHCAICRKRKVPDVLFATINPPIEVQTFGKGCLIQARICRTKKEGKGESNAKEISDSLPFMEYELHNQLMNKLKLRGMNGLFGLRMQITIGETLLVGIATATATFLQPLPSPPIPRLSAQVMSEADNIGLTELQKKLVETVHKNRELYDLHLLDGVGQPSPLSTTSDDSDEELSDLDLSIGNKETFVLQVDDPNDEMVSTVLRDLPSMEGFEICNTENVPGVMNMTANLQLFTQVWRMELSPDHMTSSDISHLFEKLLRRICFKLRKMTPCSLCNLDFNLEIPDDEEVQISITGMCVGLGDPVTKMDSYLELPPLDKKGSRASSVPSSGVSSVPSGVSSVPSSGVSSEKGEMMFDMEEVADGNVLNLSSSKGSKVFKSDSQKKFPYHLPPKARYGVDLTPMSYIPGGKIEHYLGNFNFFFIRESTSVREMGGVCGFIQSFLAEVLAIVRAHVASLGGNALVAYRMDECLLMSNLHKNQSQCLINVSGDAVSVMYETDIPAPSSLELLRKPSETPSAPADLGGR